MPRSLLTARAWSSVAALSGGGRRGGEWMRMAAGRPAALTMMTTRGFADELAPKQNARERVTKQMMPGGVLPEGYRGSRRAKRFKARRRLQRLDARRRKKETSASLQARDAARQKRWKEGVEKTAVWREEGIAEEARVLAAALPRVARA